MNKQLQGIMLLMMITLNSCSYQKSGDKNAETVSTGFTRDTAVVNDILRKVENNVYPDSDTAIFLLDNAIHISEKIGYMKGLSGCAFLKGKELCNQNNYSTALAQYEEVLRIAEKENDTLLKARCLVRMASVLLDTGDDYKAMNLYFQALPLFELTGDKAGIAEVYNVIGGNKISQREFVNGESYLNKAMKLNEETGNQAGVIHNKANLAFMYHYKGVDDKARKLYTELIPMLLESGDSINLSTVYSHLSLFYQWTSKPDSSLVYLKKAIKISEKSDDRANLSTFYGMTGMVYMDKHDYNSASYFLKKSIILAKSMNDFLTQRQALQLLLSIDTLSGNYVNATIRFKEILTLNDSVYQQRIRNNLEASELRYDNQKKSNYIDIQAARLLTANKKKQYLNLLFVLSLAFSFFLVFLILLLRKNNKRKQELLKEKLRINELQLENSNKTLEINRLRIENADHLLKIKGNEQITNALALEQKNELLGVIKSRLQEMKVNAGTIDEKYFNTILSSISMQSDPEDDSNMFNQKFISLHPDFFNKLKQMHPDLTKSELRFCAYLKLNLDSVQVAHIHNITSEAIRKSRYRIRKKFGLSPDASLEDYVSNI